MLDFYASVKYCNAFLMSLISHKKNHVAPNVSPKSHVKKAFYMRKPNMKSNRKKKKRSPHMTNWGKSSPQIFYYNFTKVVVFGFIMSIKFWFIMTFFW